MAADRSTPLSLASKPLFDAGWPEFATPLPAPRGAIHCRAAQDDCGRRVAGGDAPARSTAPSSNALIPGMRPAMGPRACSSRAAPTSTSPRSTPPISRRFAGAGGDGRDRRRAAVARDGRRAWTVATRRRARSRAAMLVNAAGAWADEVAAARRRAPLGIAALPAHDGPAARRSTRPRATCRWSSTAPAASTSRPRATAALAQPARRDADRAVRRRARGDRRRHRDRPVRAGGRLAGRGGRAQLGRPAQLRARPAAGLRLRLRRAAASSGAPGRAASASRPRPPRRSWRRALLLGERADARRRRRRSIRRPSFAPATVRLSARCASAAAQASASARSFSGWPAWPLTQCQSTWCGLGRVEQLLPQLGILDRLPVGGPPAVAAPAVDPLGDAVADVDAVGVEADPARPLQRLERRDRGEQLHPVVGGQRLAAGQLLLARARADHRAPAARARDCPCRRRR